MWDEIMCIWYLFSSCRLKSNQTDMHLSNSLKATMVEYGVLNWSFLLWGSHRKAENIKRNPSKCWTWRPNVRHAPQTTLAIIAAALMNLTLHPMSVNRLLGSATYKLPHQLFGGALQLRPVGNTAGPTPTICPSETAVLAALVPSRFYNVYLTHTSTNAVTLFAASKLQTSFLFLSSPTLMLQSNFLTDRVLSNQI